VTRPTTTGSTPDLSSPIQAPCGDQGSEEGDCDEERKQVNARRVDRRDHDHGDDVVHDGHGEHERTQAVGEAGPDEGEQAEREGGVRRHRDPPASGGATTGVEGEIEPDCGRHPADPGQERQREAPALAQLAEIELTAGFEADDEEEERHQPAVHPMTQVEDDARVSDVDPQGRAPQPLVGGRVDVGPRERRNGGCQQHRSTAGLGP